MNSHQRRVCDRYWPYDIHLQCGNDLLDEILEWLTETFGSCKFKGKRMPVWCYRPEWVAGRGNFTMHPYGASLFFRREKDYALFLLKWEPAGWQ